MNPAYVRRDDLHLGATLTALAAGPDGRRLYVGRGLSDDQARENLAVLDVDPDTGTVLGRRLLRDSDAPLPDSYLVPQPNRPRATVTAVLVAERYRKLYLAASLEDPAARPRRLLSVYDLDPAGDPVPGSLRTYRADVDSFGGGVEVDGLALNPVTGVLYLTGGKWIAVRWYRLSESGEPVGDQPSVLALPGSSGVLTPRVDPAGTRLYLGRAPRTLTVLRLVDGVPTLEPGGTPLLTLASAVPEVALGGEGYLRLAATPRALVATRSLPTLTGSQRARPVPLFVLPLDEAGDVAAPDWQRLDGFDHVLSAVAADRLWLAAEASTPAGVPDGFELVAYALGPDGRPGAELERHPVRWGEQPVLAAVGGTGQPAVLSRPVGPPADHVAGEHIRFRVTTGSPAQLSCTLFGPWTQVSDTFSVAAGELSAPLSLDKYLTGQPGPVPVRLRFTPTLAPGVEYTVEAHHEGQVRSATVRGRDALFLLPGYAMVPRGPAQAFHEAWTAWRAAAEAVAVRPPERPEQLVLSAYSLSGGQGHAGQLEDGVATVRALGLNSVQLGVWDGIPAAELAEATAGLSPESGEYAVPLGLPYAFAFDGSLTDTATGAVVDQAYLRAWAEKAAAAIRPAAGVSPGRVVRFQLGDEPSWYFPGVLGLTSLDAPVLPPGVRWSDPAARNQAWVRRFQAFVARRDPELVLTFGDAWPGTVPIGASGATTPARKRLFYWSARFLVTEATEGVRRMEAELQTAFAAERAPDPRPEHDRLHVHLNFGETLDWQWHKPYPGEHGDKNPDTGPDAATGGYDWFTLGAGSAVLPSKHTYQQDAGAQVWSYYADLLRSAAPAFTAFVPGSALGRLPAGAAYKLGSVLSRGAKMAVAYAFGPEFLFPPPNGWAGNLAAYGPLADAVRLAGRAEDVLYPGRPEPGRVAIHLPATSRLWDRTQGGPAYAREVLPLHTALVHDGYAVDFVDDDRLAAGVGGWSALYLLGPNLPRAAQRAVADWVQAGGTLVVLPGAATADEADEPCGVVGELLGVTGMTGWEPLRREAHLSPAFGRSQRLTVTDPVWLAALDGPERPLRDLVVDPRTVRTLVDLPRLTPAGAAVVATMTPDGSPAVTRNAVGAGAVYAYAFYPGWQYWCTATHPAYVKGLLDVHTDRLPKWWDGQDRLLAALPARLAGTPRSVETDRGAVEVRRLQSDRGIAVHLANWTGAPVESLEVTVHRVGAFRRVRSARHGPLRNLLSDSDDAIVRLPLADVDILVLEA